MASEEQLLDLIRKAVEEKTFTLEGLKAVEELKKSAEANRQKLVDYESRIADYVKKSEAHNAEIAGLLVTIAEYKKQENEMKRRESYLVQMDVKTAVAEAKAGTIADMFQTIFKNTIVREHVQKSVVTELPVQYPGQIPIMHTRQGDSEIKTTQKE